MKYSCDCGKKFAHQSSLSRHKQKCNYTNSDDSNKIKIELEKTKKELEKNKKESEKIKADMENKIREIENKMLDLEKNRLEIANNQLIELMKNIGKTQNITNNTTNNTVYKLSIRNYASKYYSNAPSIEAPKSYEKLKHTESELIDTLISKYNKKKIHAYLGDFLVKYYKKDNPVDQSIWSSDISRLSYIVKESLENKESIWNRDYKGVKTKRYIVDPLLKHIKNYLNDYWEKNLVDTHIKNNKVDVDALLKRQNKYNVIHQIKSDIDNGTLANNIIKYIAPELHMSRNDNIIDKIKEDSDEDNDSIDDDCNQGKIITQFIDKN